MRVFLKTFGCTFNKADSDRMAGILADRGHKMAESERQADVIVLNSCSVKDATQEKIRYRIEHALKPLVVAGCIAQAMPEFVLKYNPKASIVGTFAQNRIADAVEAAFSGAVFRSVENHGLPRGLTSDGGVFARIQINSGCASACSFCSTKLARGGVRSYRPSEVIEAVQNAVKRGAKEIQLASQDTGAYGLDCGVTLPQLLERICKVKGEYRVRVGMCNPQHFLRLEKQLLNVFAGNPKLYKFFHIPVQSASDGVLKAMKRGYTASQAKRAVESIKNAFPDAMLATDVIVGYPTEGEKDFEETLEFMRWAEFDVVNVSKFSPRPGTPAAKLEVIDNGIVKKRSGMASALARSLSLRKNKRFIGKRVKALINEKAKDGVSGRTDDYRPVIFKTGEIGSWVEGKVVGAHDGCLIADSSISVSRKHFNKRGG